MKTRSFREGFYLWLSKHHRLLDVICIICIFLILVSIVAEIFVWLNPDWFGTRLTLWGALLILAIPAICGLSWLVWCSWFCIHFRYVWFWVASGLGALRKWANTGWRGGVLALLSTSIIVWVFNSAVIQEGEPMSFPQSFFAKPYHLWLQALVLAALSGVTWSAYQGRKRIVIHPFADYSSKKSLKIMIAGLPQQLQVELGSIAQIQKKLGADLSDITSTAGLEEYKSSAPTYDTSGAGESFKDIVSSKSELKVGPLGIPIAPLIRMVSGLLKARQITGCVRSVGDQFLIEAAMNDGKVVRQWRIRQDELQELAVRNDDAPTRDLSQSEVLGRMMEQLAYQIFTDVEDKKLDSTSWRAVAQVIQGWKQLSNVSHSQDQSRKNQFYRIAEMHFVRALKEDQDFALGHYNLGVIYYRLKRYWVARVAFQNAAAGRPRKTQYLVALARTERLLGDEAKKKRKNEVARSYYDQAIAICEQALTFSHDDPPSWNLRGLCLANCIDMDKEVDRLAKEAGPYFNIAAAFSWQQLCVEQFQQHKNTPATIESAKLHCGNLAKTTNDHRPINQAIQLDPTARESYFEKGKILFENTQRLFKNEQDTPEKGKLLHSQKPLEDAAVAFERAAVLSDKHEYWVRLAFTRDFLSQNIPPAGQDPEGKAKLTHAWQKSLDCLNFYQDKKKEDLDYKELELYKKQKNSNQVTVFLKIVDLWDEITKDRKNTDGLIKKLDAWQLKLKQILEPPSEGMESQSKNELKASTGEKVDTQSSTELEKLKKSKAEVAMVLMKLTDKLSENQSEGIYFGKLSETQFRGCLIAAHLISLLLLEPAEAEIVQSLLTIISRIKARYPRLVTDFGLYGMLSNAYRQLKKFDLARYAAEESVALNSSGSWERQILASVYVELRDLDRADSELSVGDNLRPGEFDVRTQIIDSYWKKIIRVTDRTKRRQAVQDLVGILEQAVAVTDSEFLKLCSFEDNDPNKVEDFTDQAKKSVADNFIQKGYSHFWLGLAAEELNDFDTALNHFNIAVGCQFYPAESRAEMCNVAFQAKAYGSVENAFQELRQLVRERKKAGPVQPDRLPQEFCLAYGYVLSVRALVEGLGDLALAKKRLKMVARLVKIKKILQLEEANRCGLNTAIATTEGMIHLVRARRSSPIDEEEMAAETGKAIAKFQTSVAIPLTNHAEDYHWLAAACEAQARLDVPNKKHWKAQAELARQNRDLSDYRGQYSTEQKEAGRSPVKPSGEES